MSMMYDFSILRKLRKREGLNIADVSNKSGVSAAVISKLERNQSVAELETLYKLSRVFGINCADLIALAEHSSAHKVTASSHTTNEFHFSEIHYSNIRCLYGKAKAGAKASKPKIHHDDFELCWVLKGKLMFYLPNETVELNAGESIQFDALLEHTYEAVENCEIFISHIKKSNRY